jgi:anti-sigma regulatory factor (Ser/Thr protein kinase)
MCGAASPRAGDGLVHEAMLYGSDDEFLAMAVPFLDGGTAAGDATFLGVSPRLHEMLVPELDDASRVTMVDGQYDSSLGALRANHRLFEEQLQAGVKQIRMFGEVPSAADSWGQWARYEAVINHFYSHFPVWGICPYDTRVTAPEVLDDVVRTHSRLTTADGHASNSSYSDPAAFLARHARNEVDPVEGRRPNLEMDNPLPEDARTAVVALAQGRGMDRATADGLGLATCEVTTNAHTHGSPPVGLRAWAEADRVVVAISDLGTGPDDPYAGMLPRPTAKAGLGLHIAYQVCETTLTYSAAEFTVHLVSRSR